MALKIERQHLLPIRRRRYLEEMFEALKIISKRHQNVEQYFYFIFAIMYNLQTCVFVLLSSNNFKEGLLSTQKQICLLC